jgi:hypothetical protein
VCQLDGLENDESPKLVFFFQPVLPDAAGSEVEASEHVSPIHAVDWHLFGFLNGRSFGRCPQTLIVALKTSERSSHQCPEGKSRNALPKPKKDWSANSCLKPCFVCEICRVAFCSLPPTTVNLVILLVVGRTCRPSSF